MEMIRLPDFRYYAINIKGHKVKGIMNAKDEAALKATLLEQNIFLLDVKNESKKSRSKKLSVLELSEFSRELNAMLSSGIPLVKSINIIMNRDLPKNIKNTFAELNSCIKRGCSLSEAMELQNNVFPELMINMIKSGEESGRLDDTTEKLAAMYNKEHRLKVKIKTAMAYPLFLLIMTIVIMIIIFKFVLPKFMKLFDDIELPATTKFVMSIGEVFSNHFFAIIMCTVLIALCIFCMSKNRLLKCKFDKTILKIPVIGKLLKIIYTSRFANTLCSMYSSGISLVNAVTVSGNTVGNTYISNQITEVARKIRSGNSLSSAISEIDGFDKKLASSVAVGEESGKIDTLLLSLSDSYEYEANNAVSKIVSFIEPVMIIIMGGFVAFVVISVMQAVYTLYGVVR